LKRLLLLFFVATSLNAREVPRLGDDLFVDEVGIVGKKITGLEKVAIAVVSKDSLDGESTIEFATRIGDYYEVGDEKLDDGAVILVAYSPEKGKSEVAIATGRGTEGTFPDVVVARIIDRRILPYFKDGKYYDGLVAGVSALNEGIETGNVTKKVSDYPYLVLFIAILIFWVVSSIATRDPFFMLYLVFRVIGSGGSSGSKRSGGGSFGGGGARRSF
jgi:uncharacterized protein